MTIMRKTNFFTTLFAFILIVTMVSCSGDDDGTTQRQSGFFPSKITTTTVTNGNKVEYRLSYNNQNQLSSIIEVGGILNLSFEYDNQGLINLLSLNNLNLQSTLEYDGDVLIRAVNVESGTEIPITYSGNTYMDFSGNLLRLDDENRIIQFADERSSIDLVYTDNDGPFSYLGFQPALYLLGEDFLRATFFFSKSEISQTTFSSSTIGGDPETTYTVVVERDENDLITKATLNNQLTGDPFLEYIIEYQER